MRDNRLWGCATDVELSKRKFHPSPPLLVNVQPSTTNIPSPVKFFFAVPREFYNVRDCCIQHWSVYFFAFARRRFLHDWFIDGLNLLKYFYRHRCSRVRFSDVVFSIKIILFVVFDYAVEVRLSWFYRQSNLLLEIFSSYIRALVRYQHGMMFCPLSHEFMIPLVSCIGYILC